MCDVCCSDRFSHVATYSAGPPRRMASRHVNGWQLLDECHRATSTELELCCGPSHAVPFMRRCGGRWCPGRAVQAHPIKRTMEAAGTKRLKLKHHKLLSNVAFKFNLRRYARGAAAALQQSAVQPRGGRDPWILLATACGVMQLSDGGSKCFG